MTFGAQADALDAIDNMDLNEFHGRVIRVGPAKSAKIAAQPQGNRAVWESEAWLKVYGPKATGPAEAEAPKDDEPEAEAEPEPDADAMET